MTAFSRKPTCPNQLKNLKLCIKNIKYPPSTKRKEEVIISQAKIGHFPQHTCISSARNQHQWMILVM